MNLAKNLRDARDSRKMSRAAAADAHQHIFGKPMHPQTLFKLETGKMNITGKWLERLAKVYDVSPEALVIGHAISKFAGVVRVPIQPPAAALRGDEPDGDDFVMVSNHDVPQAQSADLGAVLLGDSVIVFDRRNTEPEPRSTYLIERYGLMERREYRTNPERWEAPGTDVFTPAGATVSVIGRVVLTTIRQQYRRA